MSQPQQIYQKSLQVTSEIIENLDPESLNEIWKGGDDSDIDNLLGDIFQEVKDVFSVYTGALVDQEKFSDISNLGLTIEETLRRVSFPYFIDSVLPSFKMNWHHIEWSQLVHIYKWLCIIAARDSSKSHTFSFAYPMWKMYRYEKSTPERQIPLEYELSKEGLLITNEFSLAKKWIKKIRDEIEENEILRAKLLPDTKGEWNKESLQTKNGALLEIKSYGSSMRGPHPGYIVPDDFLDKSSLYSAEQRNKFTDTFNSEIMNMLLQGGQCINLGTPFHEDDLFGRLKKSEKWKVFEYPGIFPDGSLLDDSRHSLDELLDKRNTQGSIVFSREILVKPVSDASTIFPYEMVSKCFDRNFHLVQNYYSTHKEFVRIVGGVDLARSSTVGADYSVFVTLGIDEYNHYYLLDLWEGKGKSLGEQISQLKFLNQNFRHEVIIVENNQMQQFFVDAALVENLPVQPHTTGTNKYDLDKGLPSLALLFEQQRIHLPYENQHSKDVSDRLAMQLTSITWTEKGKLEGSGSHDDEVMGLVMGVIGARKGTGFDLIMA